MSGIAHTFIAVFFVIFAILLGVTLCLQDALVALEARARAAGAYGVSTERQLDASRPHLAPPPGAELATVHVRYVGCASRRSSPQSLYTAKMQPPRT